MISRLTGDLSSRQRLAMALCVLERMLPNYQLYAETSGAGDPRLFRQLLDIAWDMLLSRNPRINLEAQADKAELLLPPAAEEPMLGELLGMHAALGLQRMFEMCADEDERALSEIFELSRNGVEVYLSISDASADEQKALRDAEQAFVEALGTQVAGNPQLPADTARTMRQWVRALGVSNIGLES